MLEELLKDNKELCKAIVRAGADNFAYGTPVQETLSGLEISTAIQTLAVIIKENEIEEEDK